MWGVVTGTVDVGVVAGGVVLAGTCVVGVGFGVTFAATFAAAVVVVTNDGTTDVVRDDEAAANASYDAPTAIETEQQHQDPVDHSLNGERVEPRVSERGKDARGSVRGSGGRSIGAFEMRFRRRHGVVRQPFEDVIAAVVVRRDRGVFVHQPVVRAITVTFLPR